MAPFQSRTETKTPQTKNRAWWTYWVCDIITSRRSWYTVSLLVPTVVACSSSDDPALVVKPCDVRNFHSEVLNLKWYASLLTLGQAYVTTNFLFPPKVLPFIWMDLWIQTWTTWGILRTVGPGQKGCENKDVRSVCYQLKEEAGTATLDGRVHSFTHGTRKSAD